MIGGKPIAEGPAHRFQVRTRAVNQNDGRARGIPRPDIEHVERRAGNLDRLSPGGIKMLKDDDTGLRSQRQHHKRGCENH